MATLEKIPKSTKQELYFLKRYKEKQHLRNQLLFFFSGSKSNDTNESFMKILQKHARISPQ